jgi:hypothetical protein
VSNSLEYPHNIQTHRPSFLKLYTRNESESSITVLRFGQYNELAESITLIEIAYARTSATPDNASFLFILRGQKCEFLIQQFNVYPLYRIVWAKFNPAAIIRWVRNLRKSEQQYVSKTAP